jgi:HAD superfamily hydrolase (TIGR01509 family)
VTGVPAAVLWDFDGTLVDSHDQWTATWTEMAERRGRSWNDARTRELVGLGLLDTAQVIAAHFDTGEDTHALVAEMVSDVAARLRADVPWREGARELLDAIRAESIPCALVTMSYRRLVEPVLVHLQPDTFAVVVTGDEVDHPKPHPAPYLAAARALGLEPTTCLAIEDSTTGIVSAGAAGCRVLAAPNHHPLDTDVNGVVVDGLVGIDPAYLRTIMAAGDLRHIPPAKS